MSDYISRLEVEHTELSDRLEKLSAFLNQKKPEFVTAWQWEQMQEQKMHMTEYRRVLGARLADAKGEKPLTQTNLATGETVTFKD